MLRVKMIQMIANSKMAKVKKMRDAHLGLEIEGPDHAQCNDDTDDSKQ